MTSGKSWFLIFILGLTCSSWGVSDRASWANLSAVQSGQKIQIVDSNKTKHTGAFVDFSDTAISFQDATGKHTLQKREIRSVKLLKNKYRLRNTLIGGAVGAAAGAGISAAGYQCKSFCVLGRGSVAGMGAALGFVGGSIVGAVLPSHKTIYSVNLQ